MHRLHDLLSAFHDEDPTTPNDAQHIAKRLQQEFATPLRLPEPCKDATDCAVFQEIASWVAMFGFEEHALNLVPMLSEDGRELTIFVGGET